MIEKSINHLADTQKIEIDQEREGIRQIQDGNDLLFWINKLTTTDAQLEIIRGINQDSDLASFLSNTKIVLFTEDPESLHRFISVVERSQNREIKIKIGQLVSRAYDNQIRAKHGID